MTRNAILLFLSQMSRWFLPCFIFIEYLLNDWEILSLAVSSSWALWGTFRVYVDQGNWLRSNLNDVYIQWMYVPDFLEQTPFQIFSPIFPLSTFLSVRLSALESWFGKYAQCSKDADLLSRCGWTIEVCVLLGVRDVRPWISNKRAVWWAQM